MQNQIISVYGKNIKGRSFIHELTPCTLIAGRNRKGKTTIIDAIELSITSRTSSLRGANGKPVAQPREIFDALASRDTMSAGVTYADSSATGISFTKQYGTVSSKRINGGPEMPPELPPIMLDPTEYTNLSEPDRVKYIFARANLAHLTPTKLQNTVTANLKGIKLEENTPASEAVISELVEFVSGRPDAEAQDWVANLIEDAKAKLSAANANVKRMEQTQQGMTQVAGDENPAPADAEARLADARTALEVAQGDLTRLQTELETLKGQAASAGKAKALLLGVEATDIRLRAIATRQGEILAATAVPVDVTPAQDAYAAVQKLVNEQDLKVKAAEKMVSDVEAEIATAKELAAMVVDEALIKADIARLESELEGELKVAKPGDKTVAISMTTERGNAVGELASKNTLSAHVSSAQHAEQMAELKVTQLREEIAAAQKQTCCPTCGHDIADKQKFIIRDLERKLEAAAVALGKSKEATDQNSKAYALAISAYDAAVAIVDQWDKDQTALRVKNQNALDAWNDAVANFNAAQFKGNELSRQIANLNNQLAANVSAHEAWVNLPTLEKKLPVTQKEYDSVTDSYNASTDALDMACNALASVKLKQSLQSDLATESRRLDLEAQTLRASLDYVAVARGASAKLPSLQSKIGDILTSQEPALAQICYDRRWDVDAKSRDVSRLTQQRAEARTRAKAKEESDKVKIEAQVLKEFCRLLADMQAEIVNTAIGPIVDRLNVMFKGVLDMPLCYKDGVIGTESPTGFYSMRSFSGAEKALAMCAISLALAAESPVKIVVLDELGRLDFENKMRLVKVTLELQRAGSISQAILVDTASHDYMKFFGDDIFSTIEL